jgi:SAM-dependent methyltransferase
VKYDPIKDRLGALAEKHPALQRLLYGLLDLLFLRAWYVRRATRRLLSAYPPGRTIRVLDAGTGFGQYAYFVARSFPNAEVRAVDVKGDYLARAEQFARQTPQSAQLTFAQDDLTDLESDGPFDFILSVDVMEHIPDDEAVFQNFARVLRPGGRVLINTPSDKGGSGVTEADDESFIEEHARAGYNRAELEAKLQRAGLEPETCEYTYGPYGSAAWKLLIKRPMLMLNGGWAAKLLAPLYYAAALPVGLLLNALDVRRDNAEGTGLLTVARKPE